MPIKVEDHEHLIVVVSGGGPVGLTFALHLTMMMGKHVKIFIYEGRWIVDQQGRIQWQGGKQGKTRRDQVVTLQDHVIKQMPEYIQQGLFQNINECVWPTSRNIPIREVEDRLLDLIQPFVHSGQIELIPENLHEQSECLIKGNFDLLVGTDGSNSFVRRYCNIQMMSEGLEYACGVAYDIPDNVPPTEEPLHQALNCILTVSQTRYLVNSSTSRRGYLNVRLTQDEYDELQSRLETFQLRNESLDLLDYNKCPQSPVWTIIRQGLDFFKISPKYVSRVVLIEINVRHASIVARELRYEIETDPQKANKYNEKKYKTALAFLAGDAAMSVHFWPGRGMNSGMKAAIALARNILRACTSNNAINIRKPLRFLDFLDYEGFMARLRAREQQGRSLRVLVDPIDKSVEEAYSYAHNPYCYERYITNLIHKLKITRQRLQENPEWPHKSRPITDDELQTLSNRTAPYAVAQLSLANPWPTREMSGAEVLVEHMFPYDLNRCSPLPVTRCPSLHRTNSMMIRCNFQILWIIDDNKNENIKNIFKDIENSQNTLRLSTNKDCDYQMTSVQTIDQAKQWLTTNQESLRQPHIRLKVITLWTIEKDKTAINVIRAVRSICLRVPILIFTTKQDKIRAALEFPNVVATDKEYEVKEFVGLNQGPLWNAGCQVSYTMMESFGNKGIQPLPIVTSDTIHLDCVSQNAMLLWIDSPKNDPQLTEAVQTNYPSLKINFQPTYQDARKYLNDNAYDIRKREIFITICRAYYTKESKCFTDVVQLFRDLGIGNRPIAVYTLSKIVLLEKTPDLPTGIEVYDNPDELFTFI
ncbi:unnamed protein product, partial [Rotaria sordida]